MRISIICLVFSSILSLQLHEHLALGQQTGRSANRDARQSEENALELDERGQVTAVDYELSWPVIQTHRHAVLAISGKETRWSKQFRNGEQPFVDVFREEFKPGRYAFRIEYLNTELMESALRSKAAYKTRRELLAKRLKLLENGDRDGAKRAIDEANRIRAAEMERSKAERSTNRSGARDRKISKLGHFVVNEDGTVEIYDRAAERIKQDELRAEEAERREQENENEEEPDAFDP